MRVRSLTLVAIALALAAGGCKNDKSANPLSPSVAGPIAGVTITAPKLVTPASGARIEVAAQPVTLTLENAATTGQRTLYYLFEVALDADFTNKVNTKEGVTAGAGTTSYKLPEALAADRTYYWRARAQDGANTGPYATGSYFSIYTPIVIQAPALVSPVSDVRIAGRTPTFIVTNAARSGPVGSITYEIQVSTNAAFSQVVATLEQAEGVSRTTAVYNGDLAYETRYYWRARAWESSRNTAGAWSSTASFQTALKPDEGGGGGGGGGTTTYPTNGDDLVEYIMKKYPTYLAAGVSLSKRKSNMAFLRDRTIEAGNCGGMQLAWNYKRGKVGDLSYDYITYKTGGRWIGVDIARDYDNTSRKLEMVWNEQPDDPYATYGGYTNSYSCK